MLALIPNNRSLLLIVSILIYLFVNTGCDKSQRLVPNNVLRKLLELKIRETPGSYIVFDTVIKTFVWDELCIVKPYMSPTQRSVLKKKIVNISQMDLSENRYRDGITYLIFISEKKAVEYFLLPNCPCCNFNFIYDSRNPVCLDKKAVFFIDKEEPLCYRMFLKVLHNEPINQ